MWNIWNVDFNKYDQNVNYLQASCQQNVKKIL